MAVNEWNGLEEAVERIQKVLQDYLATEATNQNTALGAGDELRAPIAADVQIGPDFSFSADPVIGIEWVSSETARAYSGRHDIDLTMTVTLATWNNTAFQAVSNQLLRYERLLWLTIWKHYTHVDWPITSVSLKSSRPVVTVDPERGLDGEGVELTIVARVHLVLPTR